VASRKLTENEISAAQRRIALTSAYLKVICPGIDQSNRTRLVDSILALIDGENRRLAKTAGCLRRGSRTLTLSKWCGGTANAFAIRRASAHC